MATGYAFAWMAKTRLLSSRYGNEHLTHRLKILQIGVTPMCAYVMTPLVRCGTAPLRKRGILLLPIGIAPVTLATLAYIPDLLGPHVSWSSGPHETSSECY